MAKLEARLSIAVLLPTVFEIVGRVCALKHVARQERDDFESFVLAALLEGDCRILAQFRGEGRLAGYLRTVIARLFLDYRARRWGRWRASAQATRLGTVAIELERLIERDGCSQWEAIRHLRINLGVGISELELLALAEQLPHRSSRQFEGEEALDELPSPCAEAEAVDRYAREEAASLVRSALGQALSELGPDARCLLARHFADGLSVAEIARRSGENQRRLYRRLERTLRDLRARLQALGIDRAMVRSVLASGA